MQARWGRGYAQKALSHDAFNCDTGISNFPLNQAGA